jgi:hypothetical protein
VKEVHPVMEDAEYTLNELKFFLGEELCKADSPVV